MTTPLRFIAAPCAVLFAIVCISACGGGLPGDAVVQVGGTAITKTAFSHWMEVASASSNSSTTGAKPVVPEPPAYSACISRLAATSAKGQSPKQLKSQCEQQYKSLQTEVLGFLISADWVVGEAGALHVNLTDAEVKKQFTKIKSQQFPKQAEFNKFLVSSGQTVSDLLLRVKLNMLSQKIQAAVIKKAGTVTQAQIEKYYNENKSRFGTPEKRAVEIILTKTEAAAKSAKAEVQSGKGFASVARRVSIDPTTKAGGGLLSEVVKGQEEQALDAAIFAASPNVLSGPVKTPFGYYVYEVKSITPGTQRSLSQSQASIKAQLVSTQQQTALSKFVKEFKAKWTAKTECRSGYVVADCKESKPAKGTSSTSSTGG